jgi:hypothetical protein
LIARLPPRRRATPSAAIVIRRPTRLAPATVPSARRVSCEVRSAQLKATAEEC